MGSLFKAILLFVVVLGVFVAISTSFNHVGCAWYGYQTERETRYRLGVGCLVQTQFGWVPRNELRTAVE